MISLDTIQKSKPQPPISLIYGPQKIGKTTLASLSDNPIFILTESGLSGIENIDNWRANSYNDVINGIITLAENDHQFETLIIDNVSGLEPLLHEQLLLDWDKKTLDEIGVNGGGYFKWRVEAMPKWKYLMDCLEYLRGAKNMEIILIGHSTHREITSPDSDPYLKYTLDLMNPKPVELLYKQVDSVFFVNYKIHTRVVEEKQTKGKMTKKTSRGIGEGQRFIFTEERPAWYAGNRFSYPPEIPFEKGLNFYQLIEKYTIGD